MKYAIAAVVLALVGLIIWGIVAEDKAMEEKRTAFMGSCLQERQPYDCDLQWETYVAARAAQTNSAVAVGVAAGAAGSSAAAAAR